MGWGGGGGGGERSFEVVKDASPYQLHIADCASSICMPEVGQ